MQPLQSNPDDKTDVIAGGPPTQPLPAPAAFAPLPEGAIVSDSQNDYRIKQLKQEGPEQNEYSGVTVAGLRTCPSCGFLLNPEAESACRHCGQELQNAPLHHLHVTIKETSRPERIATEKHLAGLQLTSPHLRLPLAAFRRRVGGQYRHYLVLPPRPAERLANLPAGQELPKVLDWGVGLSQALAMLHEQGVAFGPFEPHRLGFEAGQAILTDFSKCYYPGQAKLYTQDVRQLAILLYQLLTGEKRYQPQADLPEDVQDIFARALADEQAFPTAASFGGTLDGVLRTLRRPQSVEIVVGRRTDVGQMRQLNEDSLLTLDFVWSNQSVSHPLGIFAVADGMGGHAAGEVASGLALQAVAKMAVNDLLSLEGNNQELVIGRWLEKAVAAANEAVQKEMEASQNDLGTTLVLALVTGGQVHIANVGDSRAYLMNEHEIRQVTVDHSLVERLVATGQISREEARYHPQRNVVYRTIGDRSNAEPDMWQIQLEAGDYLLLCSDGLSGMVDDETIHRIVLSSPSPQDACDGLVAAANKAGGNDNITAVLIQVKGVG